MNNSKVCATCNSVTDGICNYSSQEVNSDDTCSKWNPIKSEDITLILDGISNDIYDMTSTEALEKDICIDCKKDMKPDAFKTDAGRIEYAITGLCEDCYDKIFEEGDDDEYQD